MTTPIMARRAYGPSFALLTLSVAISAATHAQTLTDEEKAKADAAIEEMIVTSRFTTNDRLDTATGLGLTLYETPQSVSVMTSQRIFDQDLRTLTDVVNNAPGVSARGLDSSRQSFSARGFSIDNYQIDGIPMTWSSGGDAGETQSNTALYERIEVVRGATGLLTGAGNPSASVNLVRKHADSKVLTGSVNASVGRWDTYTATADVGTALNRSGSVRGRVVANYEEGDSFRDLAGDETSVFYGVVDADVTDNLLVRVGASYQDNEPTASTWGGLPVWFSDGGRTDWERSKTIGADWTSWASTVQNQFADLIYNFNDDWRLKLNVNRNVNEADLLLIYMSGTVDRDTGMGLNPSPYNAETERDQISYSAQLSGNYSLFGNEHELTLGAISSDQDFISQTRARSDVAPIGNFYEWDGSYPQPTWGEQSVASEVNTKQDGFYGATRLSLTDEFKVILGGRISNWEQTGQNYGTPVDLGDDNVFTPYAGMVYELTEQHSLYASYTEIFQPQSERDRNGDYLDPIEGINYEVGVKSRFFNDALHTTVTLFNVVQENLAQPDVGQTVPGTEPPVQASYGADGAESTGIELEMVGEIADGWDVSLSYTAFEAEDADGEPVNTNQPDQLIKLYTTYQFGGALDKLTVAGGVNWQGENYTDTTNPVTGQDERLEQDAYALVSLMTRYDITSQLSVQLNVDNLLDETYYSQIGFYNQLEYGEPRNVTASLSYQF
ncbi:TonB-dependent siderophore receptor [Gilvimarinus sp. DA14]|uniref:TonB-dependent siderophore receptor n=1 Tax=Gilvimarinus sp. DA14 TaxID=2956798 RepID=UPI0020B8D93C|nr:TonB-dependent siderophore receptor [Gilvimarinus sp. DA14]UTF60644.1 TonB-dependent siderophore receptor [Gilvimarinus sp. DA14]